MEGKRKTKTERILEHLRSGKTISQLEATYEYGATRLSDVIFRLRKRGMIINSVDCVGRDRYGNITRYVEYELIEDLPEVIA